MTHSRLGVLFLAASLTLAAAHSQSPARSIQLPGSGFVATAHGDYTDNRRDDVVLLQGQNAYLMFSPATQNSVTLMSSTWVVNDVATLRTAANDRADRLLGIGPDGLTFAQYDDNSVFSRNVLSAGNWVNGSQVDCVGSTTNANVLGLSADRTMLGVGLVGRGVFGGDVWANQGAPVLDFVPLDLDNDGNMQVAVLTAGQLRILNSALAPSLVIPGNGGMIARLHNNGAGDRLAWVRPDANGYELVVVSRTTVSTPLHLSLPLSGGPNDTFPLLGITTADANGDGRDDLAIVQNATSEIVVLYQQQSASAPFVVSSPLPTSSGKVYAYSGNPGALGTLVSMPLFVDCDCDMCADLLVTNGTIFSPLVSGDDGDGSDRPTFTDEFGFSFGHTPRESLKVRFHVPQNTAQTDVQIIVWRENAFLNPLETPQGIGIESTPYSNTHHLLLRDDKGVPEAVQEVQIEMDTNLTANVWRFWLDPFFRQPHLWIEIRFVTSIVGGDAETNPSPFSCCGATLRSMDELLEEETLAGQPFMSRLLDFGDVTPSGDLKPIWGRQLLGGIIPIFGLPSTREETLPMPGKPSAGGPATPRTANTQ